MAVAIAAADGIDPAECRRVARTRHAAAGMTDRYLALYHALAARRAGGPAAAALASAP
jgi:hypothetical protein